MEDCKNCHGTVLYGDEVCPDCGREDKEIYMTEVYTETCSKCKEEIEYTDIFSMCPLCLSSF